MEPADLLRISQLVVAYKKGQPVVDGISLTAARGECIAVLGPSGSGKTTLFRAINGFVTATSGSIQVDGMEVRTARRRGLRELRARIGVVSQRHDLVDRLSVHQNVMAGALGRWPWYRALRFLAWPLPAELAEAASALRRVGLEHKLRQPTSNLSGGEHQRVAIARTLVQNPLVLIADEPVASLDPSLSEQIIRLLCQLAREKSLILLCSLHQPQLAERFFDRIVELRSGKIVSDARRSDVPAETRWSPVF